MWNPLNLLRRICWSLRGYTCHHSWQVKVPGSCIDACLDPLISYEVICQHCATRQHLSGRTLLELYPDRFSEKPPMSALADPALATSCVACPPFLRQADPSIREALLAKPNPLSEPNYLATRFDEAGLDPLFKGDLAQVILNPPATSDPVAVPGRTGRVVRIYEGATPDLDHLVYLLEDLTDHTRFLTFYYCLVKLEPRLLSQVNK